MNDILDTFNGTFEPEFHGDECNGNFKTILQALKAAKTGATSRVAMGMSLGDNAYGDCLRNQVEELVDALGLGEDAISLEDHLIIYNRFRRAFNRAVY